MSIELMKHYIKQKYGESVRGKEVDRMSYMSPMSPEVNVSRNYLDTVLELPWGVYTKDNLNIERSRKLGDKNE